MVVGCVVGASVEVGPGVDVGANVAVGAAVAVGAGVANRQLVLKTYVLWGAAARRRGWWAAPLDSTVPARHRRNPGMKGR